MKSTLATTVALLLLFVPCHAPCQAPPNQVLPSVTVSSTLPELAAKQVPRQEVEGVLINVNDIALVGMPFRLALSGPYKWTIEPKADFDPIGSGNVYYVTPQVAGKHTITVSQDVFQLPVDELDKAPPFKNRDELAEWLKRYRVEIRETKEITVINWKPVPPGPDPGPNPDPNPPGPTPTPAPIPEPGFRVFIFYEKDDAMPALQRAILHGEEVANYLNKTCVEEADGTAGYRIYDQHADLSNELPVWQKAFQRRPEELPWVIISNGKTGTEEPLPKTPSAFIELCKKYEK